MNNIPIVRYQKTGTSLWGPPMWFTIHFSAYHYPMNPTFEQQEDMFNYILSLPTIIPCNRCKKHAKEFIEGYKRTNKIFDVVRTRDNLFKFTVDFHNNVNRRLGKREFTYQEAYSLYNANPDKAM